LKYDRLLLTNGSHPFVPPILGVTRDGVFSLRTRRDASRILERARPGTRCACIGGGLLGLEVAGALARRGVQVTVLEGFEWLLPRQLAQPAAEMLRVHTENLGIRVMCGVQTEGITGDEEARGVCIKDGEEIPAELVVLAAGVRPNSHLARQSGLEVRNGVVVDDHMRTSDDSIYAAGDVAEHRAIVYGLWPTAMGQGAVAGLNVIKGDAQQFAGVPPASQLKVLDVAMFSIGQFQRSDASFRVFEHQTPGAYYRLVCRDGKLVGANLFGDNGLAGAVKKAIEEGRQLAECRSLLERFPNLISGVREETV
jgi:NAD(P)H-nitrite reductase large subunit